MSANPIREYLAPDGAEWRAARFDLLQAEFESLAPVDLTAFHELMAAKPLGWLVVRRLYGLQPMFPGPEEHPDNLRVWSREHLLAERGWKPAQLKETLDALRGAWKSKIRAEHAAVTPAPPAEPPRTELALVDIPAELAKRGFPRRMFEIEGVFESAQREEAEWFYARVLEMDKLLNHPDPNAREYTHQLLVTELLLHRATDGLTAVKFGSKEYQAHVSSRSQLLEQYSEMLELVNKFAPWMDVSRRTMSFANAVSEIVRGYQEYYAVGTNHLINAFCTGPELQVLLRRNDRVDTRMRLGLMVHLAQCREQLFDPAFKPAIPPAILKKLDAGFREGVARVSEDERVPVLQSDKPEDEYPDIVVPPVEADRAAGEELLRRKDGGGESERGR